MCYDVEVKRRLREYTIWKHFKTPPSEQRKERAVDLEWMEKIAEMHGTAVRLENKRIAAMMNARR